MAEQNNKVVNLQLLDLHQIYKTLNVKDTTENKRVLEWFDANLLTDVSQFAKLRDKIYNHVKGTKRGNQKTASLETIQSRYVGNVRTIINKLNESHLRTLGITVTERETLFRSMGTFIEKVPKKTNETRGDNAFTQAEKGTIGHWVGEFELIIETVKNAYKAVEPLYDQMNPHKHRSAIERIIRLVLYVMEPNVRSAWHSLTPEGDSGEDNVIHFGVNDRVTVVFNKMKRDWQTPLISDLHEYTAAILRRYYDTFYEKGKHYPLFRNDNDGFWISKSWTNRVTADLKSVFDGKLSARTMRVLEIMHANEEKDGVKFTENQKIALAKARGQRYNPQQWDLYDRHMENNKGKKRVNEIGEGGSSSKKVHVDED
ncbi:hypothetical protein HK097_008984 [Rhizophlyctis rosea]|uniref:Uncharacterized protein n=1 Tax=Rhizophlyctis rosea TaxID=64517 RepID=A0AAD5SBQ9_9FUNG|nr:hypothetical protein HK097_008984 [Rhizophlyctis rosea]